MAYDVWGRWIDDAPKPEGQTYGDWYSDGKGTYTNKKNGIVFNQTQFNDWQSEQYRVNQQQEAEARRVADLKAQGLNADGSPIRPEFDSLIDKETGKLKDQYNLDLKELDPNTLEGYNMLKNLATSEGPSKYAQASTALANLKKQDTINAGVTQGNSGVNDALSMLGMRGGASSGSRERIASSGQRSVLDAKQGAYRQNSTDLLNIGKADEEMKRTALNSWATAEGNIATKNLDITNSETSANNQNLLKEKDLSRSQDFEAYKAALDKWAASKQADATAKSGGGGGKK